MSILLTTPQSFDPGHGQATIQYPEVKIVQVDHDIVAKRMVLHLQYGETINDDWHGSPLMEKHFEVIENFAGNPDGNGGGWLPGQEPDPAYDLFMVGHQASSTQTLLYDEVASALYQYLLDEDIYEGTEQ
jgi:hypothetical protein